MSSRRKSSTPCMVRVVHEEQDDPNEVMDMEILTDNYATEKEQSESSETAEDLQQENSEKPDQQTFPETVETQNTEPLEQTEQLSEKDQPPVIDDEETIEEKDRRGGL
ncbi:hypothetical protein F7725_025564 [Dissostichus mawsoni]|uniref:Uncharacterized protein n=1 Tax=Dissostichus mawsoni TaxID=36200 RepID=A0A7J5XBK3_DISMA|nr:hypothetical protein F7725_025564 [Dissostichus mawsoni]